MHECPAGSSRRCPRTESFFVPRVTGECRCLIRVPSCAQVSDNRGNTSYRGFGAVQKESTHEVTMDEAYGTIEGTNLDMLITAYVSNYHVVSPSMAYAHASVVDDGTCLFPEEAAAGGLALQC